MRTDQVSRTRRRSVVAGGGLAVASVLAVVMLVNVTRDHLFTPTGPACRATAGGTSTTLDLEQARNATTIAAVGKRMGLADHGVTIALAAAMQESKLHNLTYGDRDSVGLFQQRPSQGWGTRGQILSPGYAASAFYAKLVKVDGWQTATVTDAAQQVQRSAAPDAYARWEADARILAQALTGETAAGLTCRVSVSGASASASKVGEAMTADLGPTATASAPNLTTAQAWTAASWLIGHADDLHLATVSYGGQRWTAASGRWVPFPAASAPTVAFS